MLKERIQHTVQEIVESLQGVAMGEVKVQLELPIEFFDELPNGDYLLADCSEKGFVKIQTTINLPDKG